MRSRAHRGHACGPAAGSGGHFRSTLAVGQDHLVPLTDETLDAAATLDPPALRSLDAIHLAAAIALGDDLLAIVSYDDRMIDGARLLGLPVERPG